MKLNKIWLLIIGILTFIVSYMYDSSFSLFFKNIRFPLLDLVLGIITNFSVVIVVMLVIPSVMLYGKKRQHVYLICWAFIISVLLAFIIKLAVLRQRPDDAVYYTFFSIMKYSFPSMHSMAAFSLLPILIKHLPEQKNFWTAFASAVALSRLYFGVHFLSDVVFGSFFGYLTGLWLLELYGKGKLWLA